MREMMSEMRAQYDEEIRKLKAKVVVAGAEKASSYQG